MASARPITDSAAPWSGGAVSWGMVDPLLGGKWRGFQDCHVKPSLVLIYSVTKDELVLTRLVSHSELF